jgi:hypothetical protein
VLGSGVLQRLSSASLAFHIAAATIGDMLDFLDCATRSLISPLVMLPGQNRGISRLAKRFARQPILVRAAAPGRGKFVVFEFRRRFQEIYGTLLHRGSTDARA